MLSIPQSVNESQVVSELGVETNERKPESKANSFHKMMPVFAPLNKQAANQFSNSLSLAAQQMTIIPNKFKIMLRSNILEEVNLSSNNFIQIPYELTLCLRLKNLDMSKNQISDLSPVLKEFKNLSRLNLAHNMVRCIASQDIPYLFNLKTLILSFNEISLVTETIENLVNLRALYLDGNPFVSLPTSLRNCRSLKELKLEWGSYIQPPCSMKITCSEVLEKINEKTPSNEKILTLQALRSFLKSISESKRVFTFMDFAEVFGSINIEKLDSVLEKSLHLNHQGISLAILSSQQTLKELPKEKDFLQMAVDKNRKIVVLYMLSVGTKVQTVCNSKGESLFHFAINCWSPKIIDYLSDRNISGVTADNLGNTPLHKLMMKKDRYSYYPVQKGSSLKLKIERQRESLVHADWRESRNSPVGKFQRFGLSKAGEGLQASTSQKVDLDQTRAAFLSDVIKIFVKLVKTGCDPNQYNNEGICCWHSVLIQDDYYLFSLLRNAAFSELSTIDWTLDRLSPSESVLHLAAKCTVQRFFIDFICGPDKLDMLKIDEELHLADRHLREGRHYTSYKLYAKAFKVQIREHFKRNLIRPDWASSALYKRSDTNKNTTSLSFTKSPRPVSQEKIKVFNCDSIRRLQGSLAILEREGTLKGYRCTERR
jgi:hypothetical protein